MLVSGPTLYSEMTLCIPSGSVVNQAIHIKQIKSFVQYHMEFGPAKGRSETPPSREFLFTRIPNMGIGQSQPAQQETPVGVKRSREINHTSEAGPTKMSIEPASPNPSCCASVHHRNGVGSSNTNSKLPPPCFLCIYADEPVGVQYTNFIMKQTAQSSRGQIARMVSEDIHNREMSTGRVPEGATAVDIERHIATHMLHPSVKLTEILKELDGVRRLLRGKITDVCPESGTPTIDTSNVSLYLRVVREIQSVYKLGDHSKLSLGGAGLPAASITSDI